MNMCTKLQQTAKKITSYGSVDSFDAGPIFPPVVCKIRTASRYRHCTVPFRGASTFTQNLFLPSNLTPRKIKDIDTTGNVL